MSIQLGMLSVLMKMKWKEKFLSQQNKYLLLYDIKYLPNDEVGGGQGG
jgi:hypothetical protein